jgi:hypothetical protein
MSETALEEKHQGAATKSRFSSKRVEFSKRLQVRSKASLDTRHILAGVLLLAAICAIRMYQNWGTWGNLSTDAGREVYVSVIVKNGGSLYRDVWYPFGPVAPYLNAVLFRIFGVHIFVPYFVGTISALGSAIFLFLAGIELGFPWAGWTTGAVVALQAFEPGWSSFLLPYSSAAVYACLISCMFLWLLLRGLVSGGWLWGISAGMLAALALLSKPEFGLTCYPILAAAMIYRGIYYKDWKRVAQDVASMIPGIALCAAVIAWMSSLRGWNFIAQENILMWPTSYFMKTFGREWLASTGFEVSWEGLRGAMLRTVMPLGAWVVIARVASHCKGKNSLRGVVLTVAIAVGLLAYWRHFAVVSSLPLLVVAVFFPMPMVMYTVLATLVGAWYLVRNGFEPHIARVVLLLGFSGLLAFRIMFKAVPEGYPVFYDGAAVLGYLIVLSLLLRRESDEGLRFRLEYTALAGCLLAALIVTAAPSGAKARLVSLQTAFGTVRAAPRAAATYQAAIAFMEEKNARGQRVMVMPEDTMLYVLSGTNAPTRVNAFVPGILAPGKMTEELFQEIECKPVDYLLWSNRTFSEYGVPVFGKDFNQELAHFLTARYKPAGLLLPDNYRSSQLSFMIWQREEDHAPVSCPGHS